MGFPIVAATLGGTAIGSAVGAFTSTYVSPMLSPTTAANNYAAWAGQRILLPDVPHIITLWNQKSLSAEWVQYFSAFHGISLHDNWENGQNWNSWTVRQQVWSKLFNSTVQALSIDDARRLKELGSLSDAAWNWTLDKNGFRDQQVRNKLADPRDVPPLSLLMSAFNRNDITQLDFRKYLRAAGYTGQEERDLITNQCFGIPGHQDVISFAVREVWDQTVVDRFRYDDEFPPVFQMWMNKQGYGWKPSDLGYAVPPEQDITWARAYWRAHWQMMSPTQAGYAVHLLREFPSGSGQSRIAGVPPFTRDDFNTIMRIADYPPIIREWLYGLSFTPLTRVDIRRMNRMGLLRGNQLFSAYRDLGYSPANARALQEFTETETMRTETRRDTMRMETVIRNAFSDGIMTRGEAARWLYYLRRNSPAEQAVYRARPEQEQETIALARPEIALLLDVVSLQKNARMSRILVKAIKASFLRKELTQLQTENLLRQAGLEVADAQAAVLEVQMLQQLKGKTATVSQIAGWVKRRAISVQEAAARLQQLSVPNRDINIILGLAVQDASIAANREAERLATSERQKRKAQEQQLKQMEQNRRRIMADLNKSASRKTIQDWIAKELITPQSGYEAMVKRGVFPIDAALYTAEAVKDLGEKHAKQIEEIAKQADKAATELGISSGGGLPVQEQS